MTIEEIEATKTGNYLEDFFCTNKTIYLMYNNHTGLSKIGITNNIRRRHRQLQLQSGCNIELREWMYLGKLQPLDIKEVEEALHKKYKPYRVVGEWFDLPEENNAVDDIHTLAEFGYIE